MKYSYDKQTVTRVNVKPSEVYSQGVQVTLIPNILKTNKIIAFRPPVVGESYIAWDGLVAIVDKYSSSFSDRDPRFIIEAKPVVFEKPFPEWE